MKVSRRVITIAVSALVLVAGVVMGLLPVTASITQVKPQLRLLTAECGNGFLLTTPPVLPGDLVALPSERDVFLPKQTYADHCSDAVGVRRYASWGLTALGVLGLAVTLAGGSSAPSTPKPRSESKRAEQAEPEVEPELDEHDAEAESSSDEPGSSPTASSGGAHRR